MESVVEERTAKVVQKNSSLGRAVDMESIGNRFNSCFFFPHYFYYYLSSIFYRFKKKRGLKRIEKR